MNKIKNSDKGFTLLELLVVVIIIGILAAIALPQYRKAVGKAELTQVISATKAIQNAQERFYLANGSYTTSLNKLDVSLPNNNTVCDINENYSTCYNKNYLFVHYYIETHVPNWIQCYAKNQTLAKACGDFAGKEPELTTHNLCKKISSTSNCYGVGGIKIPM